jgi:hypothetical protein
MDLRREFGIRIHRGGVAKLSTEPAADIGRFLDGGGRTRALAEG